MAETAMSGDSPWTCLREPCPQRTRLGTVPGHVRFGRDSNRHVWLVVSLVAAEVLSRRDAAVRLPALLRGAVRHGRAQLDGLPPAERGPVPPLGRRRAGRLRVLG